MRDPRPTAMRARMWIDDVNGILRIGLTMYKKLRANRHKAHWMQEGVESSFLLRRLEDELAELCDAQNAFTPISLDIMEEAADVANFAMMLHERARLREVSWLKGR